MVKYKCDHCGKEIEVKNEGKLLYPEFVTVCQGEAFVYCSNSCQKKGTYNIVTSKEVEQYLKNFNISLPNYLQQLVAF